MSPHPDPRTAYSFPQTITKCKGEVGVKRDVIYPTAIFKKSYICQYDKNI